MPETTVVCPNCGASVPDDAQYCIDCGAPVVTPATEVAPAATGPTVHLSERPAAPAPPPQAVPASAWYDDLIVPLLLVVGALAFLSTPRYGPYILVAIGAAGLLIRSLRSIPARGVLAAIVITGAALLFVSRKLIWPLIIAALVVVALFGRRGRRLW
ncbi:MAG: zinc ribbon domain-containing protein [Chloroflexi bacterium]|nr:zinc ribbon domain-containing protein [Chloroflexota bacterium]